MIMKSIIILFRDTPIWVYILMCLPLAGCNSKVRHQSQLLIKNELGVPIEVTIHPKAFLLSLGGYKSSPSEVGTFSKQFTLSEKREREIYYDTKFGIEPAELATSVFDSITIVAGNAVLRLRPGRTTGYKFGPFESDENWVLEKVEFDAPTQWKRNPVKSENFYFVIKEENIVR